MNVAPLRKATPLGSVEVAVSIPIMVRDAFVARLQAIPWFATFNFTTNKSLQIQPQNIPFCGVYFIDQQMTPDGDANVGEVRFRTTTRLGFSVIVQNNDAVQAEYHLDRAFLLITSLFADPTLYDWRNIGTHGQIQAFTRGVRSHQFGAIGQNNEIPIAELRFDLTCDIGVIEYPPTVTDEFRLLHLQTNYPPSYSQSQRDAIQQTIAVWDIDQGDSVFQDGARFLGSSRLSVNATKIP